MGKVNDCVHYMKTRMIENPFKIYFEERGCYCTVKI